MKRKAFTLVELLVVIGIIAVLIGILLPALSRAKIQARRVKDLSNIRQVAVACVNYATENKGYYPVGNRQGADLTYNGPNGDDLVWINTYAFDYFLQFMVNQSAAATWMALPASTTVPLDNNIQRLMSCVGIAETPWVSSVGYTPYRFSDPVHYTETYMGFFYWGRRANSLQGPVYDQNGNAVTPAVKYTFPIHQGDRPTSRVLVSCPAYAGTSYGWLPHYTSSDGFRDGANLSGTANPNQTLTLQMQGENFAYIDGSASWVPRKKLWSFQEGSEFIFFDPSK